MPFTIASPAIEQLMDTTTILQEIVVRMSARAFPAVHHPELGPVPRRVLAEGIGPLDYSDWDQQREQYFAAIRTGAVLDMALMEAQFRQMLPGSTAAAVQAQSRNWASARRLHPRFWQHCRRKVPPGLPRQDAPMPPLPSADFLRLRAFVAERMRMSPIEQPLMLLELLGRRSPAPAQDVARRILGNGITACGDGRDSLIGGDDLSDAERDALLQQCRERRITCSS